MADDLGIRKGFARKAVVDAFEDAADGIDVALEPFVEIQRRFH